MTKPNLGDFDPEDLQRRMRERRDDQFLVLAWVVLTLSISTACLVTYLVWSAL